MTDLSTYRPRRSCLYMPGSNARALEKARSLAADTIILDLEDAVAPPLKQEARERACSLLRDNPYSGKEVVLRINGLDTPWGADDIQAAVAAGPDAVLAPKVESASQVLALHQALEDGGAARELALWAMIETPLAILNVGEIAAAASETRLQALVLGPNDLAKDMRVAPGADRRCFWYALSALVTAARAHRLVAIDGVFNVIGDAEGLKAECLQGKEFGFDGKSLIHPSQLDTANAVFSPDPEAVDEARRIVEAFSAEEHAEAGVITVNGKMVERLHLEEARQLLAVQAAIDLVTG